MDPRDQMPSDGRDETVAARLLHPATGTWRPVELAADHGLLAITGTDTGSERGRLEIPLTGVLAVDAIGAPVAAATEVEVVLDRYPPLRLRLSDEVLDDLLAALTASTADPPVPAAVVSAPGPAAPMPTAAADPGPRPVGTGGRDGRVLRRITAAAPRVWAAFAIVCVTVATAAFLGGAFARGTSAGSSLAEALATAGAVFLGATACALVGFAFSATRTAAGARPGGEAVQAAAFASGIIFLVALVLSGILISERVEPDLGLHPATTEVISDTGTPGDGAVGDCPATVSPDGC